MFARYAPLVAAVTSMAVLSACSALLAADPTPVPGAAATLTRSSRTPIPTPVRTPASPVASAVASRVAVAASPSAVGRDVTDDEVAQVQAQVTQAVADPNLPGIERLLLDHVSLSTADGGQVLDNAAAASWLRDHAGNGISVTRVDRSTLSVLLEVLTEGWPIRAPLDQGQVSFSFRRYDANGRLDEDNGNWKVDVITAT